MIMGDCYFMKNYTNYRGEIKTKDRREDLVIRSEDLGMVDNKYTNTHPVLKIVNGSYGIWFYESDLWNKEHLIQKLRELIDDLDKFQADGNDESRIYKVHKIEY